MCEDRVFGPCELNVLLQSSDIIVRFIFLIFETHLLSDNVGSHPLIMNLIAFVGDHENQVETRQDRR